MLANISSQTLISWIDFLPGFALAVIESVIYFKLPFHPVASELMTDD